ncbi:MAG: 3'-5' exonuclease, partial [Candidatus Acidiferrum sp.]
MSIHQAKGLEFPIVFIPDFAAEHTGGRHPTAVWDRNLGCVARNPADANETPFPEFGWRLYKAVEEMEDWHEELRTLYVACTRARDCLVISACLKEDLPAKNGWMLAMAEQFDLATGACIAANVKEAEKPAIRVFSSLRSPPAPSVLRKKRTPAPLPPADLIFGNELRDADEADVGWLSAGESEGPAYWP